MAKTLRDVQLECELYPYSEECFKLMKECGEIALLEQYIERQEFLAENADLYEGLITESYFGESVGNEDMDALYESVFSKVKGALSTIWKGVCKIFGAIGKFLGLCGDKIEQQEEQIEDILTEGSESNSSGEQQEEQGDGEQKPKKSPKPAAPGYHFHWTKQKADALAKVMGSHLGNGSSFDVPQNWKGMLNVTFTYDNNNMAAAFKKNYNGPLLAALAFRGATVQLNVKQATASPAEAVSIADKLRDPEVSTAQKNVKSLNTLINTIETKKPPITFNVSADYFREQSKMLTEAATAMSQATEKIKSVNDYANRPGAVNGNKNAKDKQAKNVSSFYNDDGSAIAKGGMNAGATQALNSAYTKINSIVGNTLKVFNAYMAYRTAVIKLYGKNGAKGIGNLRDAAPETITDVSGKKHQVNAGNAVSGADLEDDSGLKNAKPAAAKKK